MKKTGIALHAGAGPDSAYVRKNIPLYEDGLSEALNAGNIIIEGGGKAIDAVIATIKHMEDNHIFNCGKGAALNNKGEIQMSASIMDGSTLDVGAACLMTNIKNPVVFVNAILHNSRSVFIGGVETSLLAKELGIET